MTGVATDTVFRTSDGVLAELQRDGQNFTVGSTSGLYDYGADGQRVAVLADPFDTIDAVAPTMISAVRLTDTTICVSFSDAIDAATITKANAGGFTVAETGTPATAYVVSAVVVGSNGNQAILTLATIAASNVAGVTVTYTAGGDGTVNDVNGNALDTDATGVAVAPWA